LVEPKPDELADVLDMLVVSLDGPESVHDLVRRRVGSYERVRRVLEGARSRGLATATITVLHRDNLDVIGDVLTVTEAAGAWAYFQPAYEECFQHRAGLDPSVTPKVLADVAARLDAAARVGRPVGASPGFRERLKRAPSFGDCSRCAAGRFFGTVMPDGTVVPCHLTSQDHSYASGRDIGFARAFATMPRPRSGPGCAISPYQEMDLIFGGDLRASMRAFQRMTTTASRPRR
jgi:MoaA/NifB/PqqE/SkfB family radical SAM enzyme